MINPFKSKRASLLEQKAASAAAHEREDAQRGAEIDRLAADPDVLVYRHAIKLEREIKVLQERRREAASTAREKINDLDSEIRVAADSKIREFIRWAFDEKMRVSNQATSRGLVEKNRLGIEGGYLLTNAPAIEAHVAALNTAIAAAKRLEASPNDDAAGELEKIRAAIPIPDIKAEKIPCDAGFAGALS